MSVKSDITKRAQQRKLSQGERLSKAPFGYKHITINGERNDVIVDKYNSHIIVKIFELYATGLYSLQSLTKKIKEDYNLIWTTSRLDKTLNNHFYYGIMVIKTKQYPHRYPTIISKDLFDTVQNIKTSNAKRRTKQAIQQTYMYQGLMRCANCTLTITPEIHKGFVYYHCTQAKGKHGAKWLREETITQQIAKVFKAMQLPKEIADLAIETLEQLYNDTIQFYTKESQRLILERKMITKAMDNLYIDKLKEKISDSEYDRFYQTFKQQLQDINSKLADMQSVDETHFMTTKKLLQLFIKIHDLFLKADIQEKRHLINLILLDLRIDGDNVICNTHKPFDMLLESSNY